MEFLDVSDWFINLSVTLTVIFIFNAVLFLPRGCNPRSIQWEFVQLGKLPSSQTIIITGNLGVQTGKKEGKD